MLHKLLEASSFVDTVLRSVSHCDAWVNFMNTLKILMVRAAPKHRKNCCLSESRMNWEVIRVFTGSIESCNASSRLILWMHDVYKAVAKTPLHPVDECTEVQMFIQLSHPPSSDIRYYSHDF